MQRIPDDSSIFTAEAKAVDLALDCIRTCDTNNKFIVFSDSFKESTDSKTFRKMSQYHVQGGYKQRKQALSKFKRSPNHNSVNDI